MVRLAFVGLLALVIGLAVHARIVRRVVQHLRSTSTTSMRSGPHHAEISFMIPNLPPGQYVLVHANESGKTVGDLSGATVIWIDAPSVRGNSELRGLTCVGV